MSILLLSIRLSCWMILVTAQILASDLYVYDRNGERTDLSLIDTAIVIRAKAVSMSMDSIFELEPALSGESPRTELPSDFWICRLVPGSDIDGVESRLKLLLGRSNVNRLYAHPQGTTLTILSRVLALFKDNVSIETIDSLAAALDLTRRREYFDDPRFLCFDLKRDAALDPLTIGNRIFESGLADFAKASTMNNVRLSGDPNDPYWQYQWNFKNPSSRSFDIGMDDAFDHASGGAEIIVAVLDDGIVPHEDLPANSIVDGYDYYYEDTDETPHDSSAHGLSRSGLIAATSGNSIGIAGMGRNHVKVMMQKVFSDPDPNYFMVEYFTTDDLAAEAIDDAVSAGARVLSLSWGCPDEPDCSGECLYSATTEALIRADAEGVSIVAAAGNLAPEIGHECIDWPANMAEVLAVGSTHANDGRWYYSQYGPEIDVMAPSGDRTFQGGSIWTLDQAGSLGYNPTYITCNPSALSYMCKFGGTSAACPQVAGLIAAVLIRRPDLAGNTNLLRDIVR